jgi:hypothetical protein
MFTEQRNAARHQDAIGEVWRELTVVGGKMLTLPSFAAQSQLPTIKPKRRV